MTGVACSRKSGPYCRQVSNGVFASVPLTGKNSSVGLRTTWYTQLVADQTRRRAVPAMSSRAQGGAARNARSARRRARARGQTNAIRNRRTRAFRGRPALATAPYGTDLLCVHGRPSPSRLSPLFASARPFSRRLEKGLRGADRPINCDLHGGPNRVIYQERRVCLEDDRGVVDGFRSRWRGLGCMSR